MFLGAARWGSAFVSMYAEVREGIVVAVAYYGKQADNGKNVISEKVFGSRAQMRSWVNSSAKFVLSNA